MVQDVTLDIATKMSDKGVFLVRKDAKEVKFYKKDEELPRYTYKRLFEDKSKNSVSEWWNLQGLYAPCLWSW